MADSELLLKILLAAGLGCLLLILWTLSSLAVFFDLRRRNAPSSEQLAWLTLAGVVPFLGAGAYLFMRLLDVFLPPAEHPGASLIQRITRLKRPPAAKPVTATIAAAELVKREQAPETLFPAAEGQIAIPTQYYVFEVIDGPESGKSFTPRQLPAVIGRGAGAALDLSQDRGISREHAEIYLKAQVLRLRDLGSAHGTQVNGIKITDKNLQPGDRIQLGSSIVLVKLAEEEDER